MACAILERISGSEPSSEITAPSCFKLATVPSFCPFTLTYLWMPVALFVFRFAFSALTSILYFVQVLSRLSQLGLLVPALPQLKHLCHIGNIIAAYANLSIIFFRASDIRSRKLLKSLGDRRYPCLTPTVVLNHFPMLPFIWTAFVALS